MQKMVLPMNVLIAVVRAKLESDSKLDLSFKILYALAKHVTVQVEHSEKNAIHVVVKALLKNSKP